MRRHIAAAVVMAASVIGCAESEPSFPRSVEAEQPTAASEIRVETEYDTEALVGGLQAGGADVRRLDASGTSGAPMLFGIAPARLCVDQQTVSVYEYDSWRDRDFASLAISSDGSQVPTENGGTAFVEWIGPPRFFARDRIIALYIGVEPDIIRRLKKLLGPSVNPEAGPGRGSLGEAC